MHMEHDELIEKWVAQVMYSAKLLTQWNQEGRRYTTNPYSSSWNVLHWVCIMYQVGISQIIRLVYFAALRLYFISSVIQSPSRQGFALTYHYEVSMTPSHRRIDWCCLSLAFTLQFCLPVRHTSWRKCVSHCATKLRRRQSFCFPR